jgi:hypothetical protein
MTGRITGLQERGVSEAIGFMLIFSIVIAGIGLVTLYGYPMLLKQQSSANERIMEKNMIVLQNDIKSLAYKTVPYKESSLKVEGGSLAVFNPDYIPPVATFSIRDGGGALIIDSFTTGDLRYQSTDTQTDISLQNGAVLKAQDSGSVMLAQPRWFYDDQTNTWAINLIAINSSKLLTRSGVSTIKMTLRDTPEYILVSPVTLPVRIDYTPDTDNAYATAWDNYFQRELKTGAPTLAGSQRTYQLPYGGGGPPRLVIKKYNIMIEAL